MSNTLSTATTGGQNGAGNGNARRKIKGRLRHDV